MFNGERSTAYTTGPICKQIGMNIEIVHFGPPDAPLSTGEIFPLTVMPYLKK